MRTTNQNPTIAKSILKGASLSAVSWSDMQAAYPRHRPANQRGGRSVWVEAFMKRSNNKQERQKPDGRN